MQAQVTRAAIGAVGIDIVEVSDVEDALARFGERYVARVYTRAELGAASGASQGRRLAAVAALKEAALKALAPGDEAADWRSIEVETGAAGGPRISLRGGLAQLAERHGILALRGTVGLSRSHALAVVVAETAA